MKESNNTQLMRETLRLIERAERFLLGVSGSERIEQLLGQFGFDDGHFDRGVMLVVRVLSDSVFGPSRYAEELRGWYVRWARAARRALQRPADLIAVGLPPSPPSQPAKPAGDDAQSIGQRKRAA